MTEVSASSKPHYIILDGLRGVAALLVVIFHLFEGIFPTLEGHPMRHGYLAVDFFFMLSGFVVGYAYDDRWSKMTVWQFFKIRLVRLHPMVIAGVLIGAIGFWFDPFVSLRPPFQFKELMLAVAFGFFLMPSKDIRGWGETHQLNGPSWSLLQEYIGNILYGIWIRKFSNLALWLLVTVSAAALAITAFWRGDIGTGWSYETFWIAVVRMMFPFFAGLFLFRMGTLIRVKHAFLFCSALLTLVFAVPYLKYNGLYEAGVIMVIFPVIVLLGAGGTVSGIMEKVCRFAGDISYPIYITHYPFIYIYTMWIYEKKPGAAQIAPVAIGLFFLFIGLAWALLKFYDTPVRNWLRKRWLFASAAKTNK
jgi:peptidoglycan/LPS O-acetylase OafA/YrhL